MSRSMRDELEHVAVSLACPSRFSRITAVKGKGMRVLRLIAQHLGMPVVLLSARSITRTLEVTRESPPCQVGMRWRFAGRGGGHDLDEF